MLTKLRFDEADNRDNGREEIRKKINEIIDVLNNHNLQKPPEK